MKPAWKDAADDILDEEGLKHRKVKSKAKVGVKYERRLIDNFHLVHGPTPSWAQLDSQKVRKRKHQESDDDSDELSDETTTNSEKSLSRGELKIFRMLDLNNESREAGKIIKSVKFHPRSQVGLVAGTSSVVTLYQVDGLKNAKIQSIKFENFPLRNACFSTDGEEILASSGRCGHFYSYNMISGDLSRVRPNRLTEHETIRNLIPSPDGKVIIGLGHHGHMYLFSSGSKEIVHTMKMNGEVNDISFNADGSRMFSTGEFGEVYTWDMNRRSCIHKFTDEGSVAGTTVASSDNFLACGSSSGVVNVYKNLDDFASLPIGSIRKPEKSLMNLVTSITSLQFNNPAGDILVMSSQEKNNAIKLVHIPSMTVFLNFPFINTHWGRPNALSFSPNSGYLGLGNNLGSVYLFRIKHYENY